MDNLNWLDRRLTMQSWWYNEFVKFGKNYRIVWSIAIFENVIKSEYLNGDTAWALAVSAEEFLAWVSRKRLGEDTK